MRINGGWIRLWVVTSVVSFFMATFLAFMTAGGLSLSKGEIERARAEIFSDLDKTTRLLYELDKLDAARLGRDSDFLQSHDDEARRIAILNRLPIFAKAYAAWLLFCVVLLLSGWAARWVYRGFKTSS